MIFFKKKKVSKPAKSSESASAPKQKKASAKSEKSMQALTHERVLTAEGWRRSVLLQERAPNPKSKKK